MSLLRSIGVCLLAGSLCVACESPRSNDNRLIQESGQELFLRYCASCHGENGRGNGPVAPFMAVPVPDLTRIAARRGGEFPPEELYQFIDGQAQLGSHGTRNMPVWGYELFGPQSDDRLAHEQATIRVQNLVSHIGTLQRPE